AARRTTPTRGARAPCRGAAAAPSRHGDEGGGGGIEAEIAPAAAARREAGAKEEAEPRPHRVELPQVTEVAETSQARPALAKDGARHVQVETRRWEAIGALRHEEPEDQGAEEREPGRGDECGAPRQVGQAPEEMRRGRAQSERAHEDADGQTPAP